MSDFALIVVGWTMGVVMTLAVAVARRPGGGCGDPECDDCQQEWHGRL